MRRHKQTACQAAVARHEGEFHLLGTSSAARSRQTKSQATRHAADHGRFDDEGWLAFLETDHHRRRAWETRDRQLRGAGERKDWIRRHEWAARNVEGSPRVEIPEVEQTGLVNNAVDQFIQHRLEAGHVAPTRRIDDLAFLRRVTLDCTGVIPTPRQIELLLADPQEMRRTYAVDRLLESPGWADHWVGYWQHVLAENPGLTKPTLNNSGPFRWYLYESFLDNKPFDRLVTELVLMDGSQRSGGPAGFALATNNDVPMAAKAHILGTAFLGVEMKCARCHDSPTHATTQQDLFGIAAMLGRKPLAVPASSTVPATPEQLAHMAVTVSLKPGQPVEPHWPLEKLSAGFPDDVPQEFIRNPTDTREQLAWRITQPANRRFPQVIVNRMWERYLGRGLVHPVHDWETGESNHAELLAHLAEELVVSGYDLKHVARLIFNSQAYQRAVDTSHAREKREALFASPTRRRMTAEQLADSIFLSVGKSFDSEPLTMNADGRQVSANFLSLGVPRRAWQFACTSNERERPSMTLPRAQSLVDLMMAYGWRQNRQEPVNRRVEETTPLTPLLLANGVAVSRGIDISDNGELVLACLENQTVEQLVARLFLRFLGRPPDAQENKRYTELLADGYGQRITNAPRRPSRVDRSPLTWSNHLDAEANRIGEERLNAALRGDPPTQRLTPQWRQRVEDMVWVLINSPEFVFVP